MTIPFHADQEDPLVVCKFYAPWTDWAWYVISAEQCADWLWYSADWMLGTVNDEPHPDEYGEGTGFEFFGLVVGQETELGFFSSAELITVRGPYGEQIERDVHFTPCKLSEIQRQLLEVGAS